MRPHELFEKISPQLATDIFSTLRAEQNATYKAAIQGLANQRNLRPVFVERKPAAERHAWMQAALARKISDAIGEHLIQAWLLGSQKQMLCDFLDSLGIEHSEDGTVEKVPESPAREKLEAAVAGLIGKYPAEAVAVYLQAFRGMDAESDWPALREMLETDPRLKLGATS